MTFTEESASLALSAELLVEATSGAYEPLPKLQAMCETFCYLRAPHLKRFAQFFFDLNFYRMNTVRWDDYVAQQDTPAAFYAFTLGAWKGQGALYVSRTVMCYLLDAFLGGCTSAEAVLDHTSRSVTSLEQKRTRDFCDAIFAEIHGILETCFPSLELEASSLELKAQDLNLATAKESVLVLEINANIDYREGHIHVILPYHTLDPLYTILKPHYREHTLTASSETWSAHLHHMAHHSATSLQAVLYKKKHDLSDVLSWKVGTFLDLNMLGHTPHVSIIWGNETFCHGVVQAQRNRLTVVITEIRQNVA